MHTSIIQREQNENYQKDRADVEWHKSRAKPMNSPILSQEHQSASIPCRQNINFWQIRSHVSQSSKTTFFQDSIVSQFPEETWIQRKSNQI